MRKGRTRKGRGEQDPFSKSNNMKELWNQIRKRISLSRLAIGSVVLVLIFMWVLHHPEYTTFRLDQIQEINNKTMYRTNPCDTFNLSVKKFDDPAVLCDLDFNCVARSNICDIPIYVNPPPAYYIYLWWVKAQFIARILLIPMAGWLIWRYRKQLKKIIKGVKDDGK